MRRASLATLHAVMAACTVTAMRSLMLLVAAMVLTACSQLFDPPDNATQLAALQKQLSQIESQVAHLAKTTSSGEGEWVLWYSETSMRDALAGSGVTPYGAYPTKSGCLDAAATWSIPDGKLIATDPYIIENKTIQVIYRCLPRGVTPYPKS